MLEQLLGLVPVVLQTLVIYVFLIVGLRLLGKRQTSELTTAELAVIMILGSAVETALIAGDSSLLAGLVSAATLFAGNKVLSLLQDHWGWLHRLMTGRPIPLIYNGKFLPKRMDQAGLTEDDVLHGLRQLGFERPEEVQLAMLEIHGRISAVPVERPGDRGSGVGGR